VDAGEVNEVIMGNLNTGMLDDDKASDMSAYARLAPEQNRAAFDGASFDGPSGSQRKHCDDEMARKDRDSKEHAGHEFIELVDNIHGLWMDRVGRHVDKAVNSSQCSACPCEKDSERRLVMQVVNEGGTCEPGQREVPLEQRKEWQYMSHYDRICMQVERAKMEESLGKPVTRPSSVKLSPSSSSSQGGTRNGNMQASPLGESDEILLSVPHSPSVQSPDIPWISPPASAKRSIEF
jgi:hypothetical protein